MAVHFQRTLYAGLVALGVTLLLTTARPDPGPGLVSGLGLSAAGLLSLTGLRSLLRETRLSRSGQRLKAHAESWFPAALILHQNFFIALILLPLWWATAELGFPATPFMHTLLMLLLGLAPLRRILEGTHTETASAGREILMEGLRYIFYSLLAILLTTCVARQGQTPGEVAPAPSPGAIFLWMPCVLIVLTCFVLFLDHILRKMPPREEIVVKDTLE